MQSSFFINTDTICRPDKSILLRAVVFSRLTTATTSQADFMVLMLKWLFPEGVIHKCSRHITIFPPPCVYVFLLVSLRNFSLLLLVVSFQGIWRLWYCVLEVQHCQAMSFGFFICRISLVWTVDESM